MLDLFFYYLEDEPQPILLNFAYLNFQSKMIKSNENLDFGVI